MNSYLILIKFITNNKCGIMIIKSYFFYKIINNKKIDIISQSLII